jgi:Ca2+/Na+ antiporter
MTYEVFITADDYLVFQLFNASQSERVKRKIRNGRYFMTIGCFLVSIYAFFAVDPFLSVFMLILGLLWWFLYGPYIKYFLKRNYKAHVKEHYADRLNIPVTITIDNDSIQSIDKTGEGKIKLSEIEKINETGNYFFIRISTGQTLIIPKAGLNETDSFRHEFESRGMAVNQMLRWKW